ncbi:hypothetical protein ACFQ80_20095 [Isoptericola sp. NPDC056578]|uniref:hypothetical protein n=1 Tax=Isoptericola sp. NPDC056578 TaxID=3345870 RepID=UPI0036A10523
MSTRRVRRSTVAAVGAAVLAAAALGGWWGLSASADVELGSMSSSGAGYRDECTYPDEGFWALFAADQDVAVVQTVRNDARWPITVTSLLPDVFRFGAVAADPRDDFAFDPSDGPPPGTTETVEIPPGREVAMWVVGPWGRLDADANRGGPAGMRTGIEHAPVRVRSLGIARETDVQLEKMLWVSDLDLGSRQFQDEITELCTE